MFKLKLHLKHLLLFIQGFLFPAYAEEGIRFEQARGAEIQRYIPDIIRLSDSFYSLYPYLYDGIQSNEEFYLRLYARWPDTLAIMVFDKDKAVGYAIGGPIKDLPTPVRQETFQAYGYSPETVFLLGEIVLLEPYRGRHIGTKMVQQIESFAKDVVKCNAITLMQINEDFVEMPKPKNYQNGEKFFLKQGYKPYKNFYFDIGWRNIGDAEESTHRLFYWIKPL